MAVSRRRAQATLILVLFVVSLGFGIVIPILPHLARELGASPFQIGLLATAYAAVGFIVSPIWGRLSDRYGRRPILLAGVFGLTLSFFLMGVATGYWSLLAARVFGGILSAATIPTARAMAADLTPPHERAQAQGSIGAAIGVGFIFGPTIGGAVVPFGIFAPFWTGAAVTFLTFLLAYLTLQEPSRQAMTGTEQASRPPRLSQALRSRTGMLFVLAMAGVFGQSTILSVLTLYLVDRYGANPSHAGIAFGLQGIATVVVQATAVGPMVRRFGEYRTILIALFVGLAGFLGLVLAPTLSVAIVASSLAVAAVGLSRPAISSAVSRTGEYGHGVSMGLLSSAESLGRAAGPLWAGIAYEWSILGPYASSATLYLLSLLYAGRRLLGEPAKNDAAQGELGYGPEPSSHDRSLSATRENVRVHR